MNEREKYMRIVTILKRYASQMGIELDNQKLNIAASVYMERFAGDEDAFSEWKEQVSEDSPDTDVREVLEMIADIKTIDIDEASEGKTIQMPDEDQTLRWRSKESHLITPHIAIDFMGLLPDTSFPSTETPTAEKPTRDNVEYKYVKVYTDNKIEIETLHGFLEQSQLIRFWISHTMNIPYIGPSNSLISIFVPASPNGYIYAIITVNVHQTPKAIDARVVTTYPSVSNYATIFGPDPSKDNVPCNMAIVSTYELLGGLSSVRFSFMHEQHLGRIFAGKSIMDISYYLWQRIFQEYSDQLLLSRQGGLISYLRTNTYVHLEDKFPYMAECIHFAFSVNYGIFHSSACSASSEMFSMERRIDNVIGYPILEFTPERISLSSKNLRQTEDPIPASLAMFELSRLMIGAFSHSVGQLFIPSKITQDLTPSSGDISTLNFKIEHQILSLNTFQFQKFVYRETEFALGLLRKPLRWSAGFDKTAFFKIHGIIILNLDDIKNLSLDEAYLLFLRAFEKAGLDAYFRLFTIYANDGYFIFAFVRRDADKKCLPYFWKKKLQKGFETIVQDTDDC